MKEKIAIIDLGSNSVRMIIVRINDDSSYELIGQVKEMVRLSEGMFENNCLKEEAMERTFSALLEFKTVISFHKVKCTIAIATAAVRNANNGMQFIGAVKEKTGFNFDVITGEREAFYDYLGAINTININDCVIIDTGGGSTELILVRDRKIINSISVPFGAVTISEKYLGKDSTSKANLNKLQEIVKSEYMKIPWLNDVKNVPIVGLGGSIRTLAKIHKRKTGFFLEPIHNYEIDIDEFNFIFDTVSNLKASERKEIPGLAKSRSDIIVGGLIPLKILFELTESNSLIISGNGLREGVFYQHYLKKYKLEGGIVEDVLQHSIDNLLLKYDADIHHCYHIKKLVLNMFDQLIDVHMLDDKFRKLLCVGAMLHDIGLHVDYYNHHYHGYYLTLNSRINGLTHRETVICAFLVGMHTNEDFRQDWTPYSCLIDEYDYDAIKKLSLLIRIAEELSKIENGNILELKCTASNDSVNIDGIKEKNTPEREIPLQCVKVFKKIFNRTLNIHI